MKGHHCLCISTLFINYVVYQWIRHWVPGGVPDRKPVPNHKYINIVKYSTLVSADLLLDYNDTIFMGIRTNQPAQGYWFNPGARLYKGETPKRGIVRILQTELGLTHRIHELFRNTFFQYKGCYEHAYNTNFKNIRGISTHYFTHAFHVVLSRNQYEGITREFVKDRQHTETAWIPKMDIYHGTYHGRLIHPFVQQFFWNTQNRIESFQGI